MRIPPFILALVVVFLLAGVPYARAHEPIVDMTSLLNTRFYDNGNILFETVDIVFAPDEPVSGAIEIHDAGGTLLQRFGFFPSYRFRDKVFGRLQADGHALWQAPGAGRYSIVFDIDGSVATRFDVSVSASGGDDPFDPATTLRYDGPWRVLGYLAKRAWRDTQLIDLVVWVGGLDLSPGTRSDDSIAILQRDGSQIGHSRIGSGHIASGHFRQTTYALFAPHEARRAHEAPPIGVSDLVDGTYELRIERVSDATPIRRFVFTVSGGVIEADPRGRLDHTPRETLLSPRVYRKGGNYAFQDAIWLGSTP